MEELSPVLLLAFNLPTPTRSVHLCHGSKSSRIVCSELSTLLKEQDTEPANRSAHKTLYVKNRRAPPNKGTRVVWCSRNVEKTQILQGLDIGPWC